MIKFRFRDEAAIGDIYRLNILTVFAVAEQIYTRQGIISVFNIIITDNIEPEIVCAVSFLLDLLYIIILRLSTLYISPTSIIATTTGVIIHPVCVGMVS